MSSDGPLKYNVDYNDIKLISKNSENAEIVKVNVPYNTNLLMQECLAMGISMRLIPKNIPDYEKINVGEEAQKFMLQDFDKRNFILQNKKKKTKIISKSEKNVDKYVKKTYGNKVMVKYIKNSVSEGDLRTLFESVGTIFDIKIANQSYMFDQAAIVYKSSEEANEAVSKLNGEVLDGEKIQVDLFSDNFSSFGTTDYGGYGYGNYLTKSPTYDAGQDYIPKSPTYDAGQDYIPKSPTYDYDAGKDYIPKSPTYDYDAGQDYIPKSPSPDYGPPKEGETEEEFQTRTGLFEKTSSIYNSPKAKEFTFDTKIPDETSPLDLDVEKVNTESDVFTFDVPEKKAEGKDAKSDIFTFDVPEKKAEGNDAEIKIVNIKESLNENLNDFSNQLNNENSEPDIGDEIDLSFDGQLTSIDLDSLI